MIGTFASAAALFTELTRRGIELQAHGDRLRYRPRSAMTPKLVEGMKTHKAALLAILRQGWPPQPPQNGQNRTTLAAAPPTGTGGRPNTPACGNASDAPHELSLAERIETGYVNPGWTPQAWAGRLRLLAERCEAIRPELAAQYRTWAANVAKSRIRDDGVA